MHILVWNIEKRSKDMGHTRHINIVAAEFGFELIDTYTSIQVYFVIRYFVFVLVVSNFLHVLPFIYKHSTSIAIRFCTSYNIEKYSGIKF